MPFRDLQRIFENRTHRNLSHIVSGLNNTHILVHMQQTYLELAIAHDDTYYKPNTPSCLTAETSSVDEEGSSLTTRIQFGDLHRIFQNMQHNPPCHKGLG